MDERKFEIKNINETRDVKEAIKELPKEPTIDEQILSLGKEIKLAELTSVKEGWDKKREELKEIEKSNQEFDDTLKERELIIIKKEALLSNKIKRAQLVIESDRKKAETDMNLAYQSTLKSSPYLVVKNKLDTVITMLEKTISTSRQGYVSLQFLVNVLEILKREEED